MSSWSEGIALGALHVQHAEHFALDEQWHGQLAPGVGQQPRIIGDVARLGGDVVRQNGSPCCATQPMMPSRPIRIERPSRRHFSFSVVAAGLRPLALNIARVAAVLHQEDLDVVVAEARLDQLDHLRQQLVQIEDAGELPAHLGDGQQIVEAALAVRVQAGVVERRGRLVRQDG